MHKTLKTMTFWGKNFRIVCRSAQFSCVRGHQIWHYRRFRSRFWWWTIRLWKLSGLLRLLLLRFLRRAPLSRLDRQKRSTKSPRRKELRLLINVVTTKFHHLKGRSPSKRLANKSGPLKRGSSRRADSTSRNGALLVTKTKVSGSCVTLGSLIPPILTHENLSMELPRGGCENYNPLTGRHVS